MDEKIYEVLNDPKLLAGKERIFRRLQAFYDGTPAERTLNLNGRVFLSGDVDPYEEPEKWVDASLAMMAEYVRNGVEDEEILRPLCLEFGPYGVHFVDKLLGAEIGQVAGQWYCRKLGTPIGSLELPDLENAPAFILARRVALRFLEHGVKLPVFGLPTIASPLNVLVNLYGEEAFYAFYEDEDAVAHDLEVIAQLQKKLHTWYRDHIPEDQLQPVVSWERTQPWGCGQICGCSTQMLSPQLYEDFIKRLDEEVLGVYPHPGMMHLCGSHTQHIPAFASMEKLKALQLHNRAAQDLKLYLEGLRPDQVIYVNCCEEMPYEEAFRISGGRRVVFVGEFAPRDTERNGGTG